MDYDNVSYHKEGKQKLHVEAKQHKELIHYFPSAGRYPVTSWEAEPQHV